MVQEQLQVSKENHKNDKVYREKSENLINNLNQKILEIQLVDCCEFIKDGTHGSFNDVSKGIPLLSAKDINNGIIELGNNPRLISLDDYKKIHKNYEIKKGDILLTIVGTIGRVAIVKDNSKFSLQRSVAILRPKNNLNNYLYYLFQSEKFQKNLTRLINFSAQGGVYLNSLKKIKINISVDENEQNLIRSTLSAIDKKIELLEKKQKEYIKFNENLLNKIFNQEIVFGEKNWKEISLNEMGDFYRGHSYNSSNVVDEGLIVLRSNNIQNNKLVFDEKQLQKVNKYCKEELILLKGDIVICMSNGTKSLVGKNAIYEGNYKEKLTVGAFCSIFRTSSPIAKYLLRTSTYKKNLYLILAGTNINNLKNDDLKKFKFNIPTEKEEIKKIDNFLSYIEKNIYYVQKELDNMYKFKKYLLQNMFC